MSTIVINPADMTGVPDFNILNDNVFEKIEYSIENTKYDFQEADANLKIYTRNNNSGNVLQLTISDKELNPNITILEDNKDVVIYTTTSSQLGTRYMYVSCSVVKFDFDIYGFDKNVLYNLHKYKIKEEMEVFTAIIDAKYTSSNIRTKTSNVEYIDDNINDSNFLDYLYSLNQWYGSRVGENSYYVKINNDNTLTVYAVICNRANNSLASNINDVEDVSWSYLDNIKISLLVKDISKESEIFKMQNADIVINSNELNQQNTTVNGQQISEYIADNIKVMYGAGKKTATITCYCVDYYDTDGNLVYKRDSGDTISVGDTVRLMIRRNDVLVPLSTLPNGSPRDFEVVSSEIFYDGKIKNTLQLVESPNSVLNVVYGNILKKSIDRSYENYTSTELGGLEKVGGYAFYNNSTIKQVVLPNTVKSIESYAFANCDSITEIKIPDTITEINSDTFSGCDNLKNIVFGNGSYKLNNYALRNLKTLRTINSENITEYGEDCLSYCDELQELTIGKDVTSFDSRAIRRCSSLSIVADSNNPNFSSENGALFNKDKTKLVAVQSGLDDNLPAVTEIGDYSLYYNGTIVDAVISNSTTTIGRSAFEGCVSLDTVTIPASVTSIGVRAFVAENLRVVKMLSSTAPELKGLVFGENVEQIQIPAGSYNNYANNLYWDELTHLFVEV